MPLFRNLLILISLLGLSLIALADITKIDATTLLTSPPADALVLDVRSSKEYREGHVPGAVNIPHKQLAERINEIAEFKHRPVITYCKSGFRAGLAQKVLVENDFSQVLHLEGDITGWLAADLPVEN